MTDVSCRVTQSHLAYAEMVGFDLEPLRRILPIVEVDGRNVDETTLRDSRQRVRWSTFVQVFRAVDVLGDRESQQHFIETSFSKQMKWIAAPARFLALTRNIDILYTHLVRWAGPSTFAVVSSDFSREADGRFRLVLTLPDQEPDLPEFFQLSGITFAKLPRLLGYPDADVQVEISTRRGEYLISVPRRKTVFGLFRTLRYYLKNLSGAVKQLEDHHAELVDSYKLLQVSEQKLREARQRLEDRADWFAGVLDDSVNEIYVFDAQTQKSLWVNKGAAKNLGYSKEELLGMTPLHISGQSQEAVDRRLKNLGETSGFYKFQSFHTRKDGSAYPVEVYLNTSQFDGKRVYVAIAVDISDRVAAEEAHSRLAARVFQAQHDSAIGMMAGGIAHELNNLLTPIVGHTAIVRTRLPEGDPSLDNMDRIDRAVGRGHQLIKQVLKKGREEEGEVQSVSVLGISSEVIKLLSPSVPADILVGFEHEDGSFLIAGHPVKIFQVVMNITQNAIHAITQKGAGGTVTLRLSRENGMVVLEVEDNGVGMDEGTRERMFEPFFSTKGTTGTGLGLAVTHDIVVRHGGKIKVRSEPGMGTLFRVEIPEFDPATSFTGPTFGGRPHGEGSRESEKPSGDRPVKPLAHILLVDDETEILAVWKELLERDGYAVHGFNRPDEALAAVVNGERVDVCVTDMNMPGMDGLALTRALKARRPGLNVILVSGYSVRIDAVSCEAAGVSRILEKPVSPSQLVDAVRELLETRSGP